MSAGKLEVFAPGVRVRLKSADDSLTRTALREAPGMAGVLVGDVGIVVTEDGCDECPCVRFDGREGEWYVYAGDLEQAP